MSSFKVNIDRQWRQEEHDRIFHPDIYNMRRVDRIKHLTLHLAKYQGKYLVAQSKGEDKQKRQVITDAYIVLMSLANVFNFELPEIKRVHWSFSFDEIVIETAALCKAVEAIDHLESSCFREAILTSVTNLLTSWMKVPGADFVGWTEVLQRLEEVESRNPHYQRYLHQYPHLRPVEVN